MYTFDIIISIIFNIVYPFFGCIGQGHDLISMSYNFLNAALYSFAGENFCCGGVQVNEYYDGGSGGGGKVTRDGDGDGDGDGGDVQNGLNKKIECSTEPYLRATLYGEFYEPLGKHGQGTEVKAITYSGMRIHVNPNDSTKYDAYIVLDI